MSCGGLYGWVRAAPVAFEKRTLRHAEIRTITIEVLQIFVQCHDSNSKEESMQEQLKTINAQYFQHLNCRPLPI